MAEKVLSVGSTQMSANPLELFVAYPGAPNSSDSGAALPSERRERSRIRVHWPVLFFRQTGAAIASTTQDLSSDGFFCITTVRFELGEALTCSLKVPSHAPNGKYFERTLECRVRVVRVLPQEPEDNAFGVAFRIEDYRFADLVHRAAH